MKQSESKKAKLFTLVLPQLKSRTPYFSIDAVKRRLKELQINVADNLLRLYLSEATTKGIIHDAGRGWYSRLAEPVALDRKPVQKLAKLLEKEFPLLDFTVWSTQQVNPWMHHLLGKFLDFVQVDKDGLSAVASFLRDKGYDVHEHPTGATARKVAARANTIVVRPLNAHAPRDGHFSPPEAVLVDLSFEVEQLGVMDVAEFRAMASRLVSSGRIAWGSFLQYAAKRERSAGDVVASEIDSLMAE